MKEKALIRAREHPVLCIAALAALVTVAFVPPDAAYLGYVDAKTLACLFGILAVVGAMRNAGMLDAAALALSSRLATRRAAVLSLTGATLALSLFATNDMALVVMLPLSAAALLRARWDDLIPFTFVMQSLAANLGGMVLPFGNPQNLYLFERFDIPLVRLPGRDGAALRPFGGADSAVLCGVRARGRSREGSRPAGACFGLRERAGPEWGRRARGRRVGSVREPGCERRARRRCGRWAQGRCGGSSTRAGRQRRERWRLPCTWRCSCWWWDRCCVWCSGGPLTAVVVGVLAVLDRKALRQVDWGLLLTFACFFVFAGNMARIPAVEGLLAQGMEGSALMVSAATSQVISNVPAAVLLSHFTGSWQALLVGVNVGGAGTLGGVAGKPHHLQPLLRRQEGLPAPRGSGGLHACEVRRALLCLQLRIPGRPAGGKRPGFRLTFAFGAYAVTTGMFILTNVVSGASGAMKWSTLPSPK